MSGRIAAAAAGQAEVVYVGEVAVQALSARLEVGVGELGAGRPVNGACVNAVGYAGVVGDERFDL